MSDEEDAVMLPSPTHMSDDDDEEDYHQDERENESPNGDLAPPEEAPAYKWFAYYDDEGRIYYYNTETQETSWDEPSEGYYPPGEETAADDRGGDAATESQADGAGATAETAAATGSAATAWVAYQDDEGAHYYYNTITGETQWEQPENFVVAVDEGADTQDVAGEPQAAAAQEEGQATLDNDMDTSAVEDSVEAAQPEVVEEEIDPEVLKLDQAKKALEQPDSILERSCVDNVTEVAKNDGGNPERAIAMLVENYVSQPAVCGFLSHWLCRVKSANAAAATSEPSEISAAVTDEIRDGIQSVIYRLAKDNFSTEVGDEILNLRTSEERSFLPAMIDSPRWRALLIDLFASHNKSAVLKFCLKEISKRGHHREIARRIDQSEHFGVFHPMLQSELTAIGRMSVSAGSDMSVGIAELLKDLEKACSSKSFTFLYSLEVIRSLIASASSLPSTPRFQRAIRKWEALSQILEESLLVSSSPASSTPSMFQKRRLDVSLTIRELHRHEKRRKTGESKNDYEQALLTLIGNYAKGMQLTEALLNRLQITEANVEAKQIVGELLIEHPIAIRALLGYLYKPGQKKVTKMATMKQKCAEIIAYGVLAAENKVKEECPALNGELGSTEFVLQKAIAAGADACDRLESKTSFLVVKASGVALVESENPGYELVGLAQEHAAVAQGVMMWAKELTRGEEFKSSASFASLSGSILSLVRVVAIDQPFARKEAIDIALQFLGHTSSEDRSVTYKQIGAIKEQSLRLLIFLLVKGEVAGVLEAMGKVITKNSGIDLDASLIRYFVGGIVSVVRPPVSFIFARLFVELLRAPSCVDAVRSDYFPPQDRVQLNALLHSFQSIPKSLKAATRQEEESMRKTYESVFDSVISMYKADGGIDI